MSRSSTSTPPPSYFPPHNVTPSMRHGSAPTMSAAMYNQRPHHHTSKRRSKNLPSSPSGISTSSARKVATQILGFSYEDIPSLKSKQARGITVVSPIPHAESSASLAMSTTSDDCFNSSCAEASLPLTTEDSFRDQHDELMDRSTSTPAMSTTGSSSTTPLATPSSSRAPSLIQHESGFADLVFRHFNLDFAGVGPSSGATPVPISSVAAPARASWVPNFGKMAKAVVHTGMSMSMSFGEKRAKKDVTLQQPRQSDSERELCKDLPLPAQGLQQVADREPTIKKGEWLAADQKRILECARLCSQWPQSGYNLAKFGPNGKLLTALD